MEDLLDILRDLHPEVDYANCGTLMDDKILDSFDLVSLISEIEAVFGVVITAKYITPENFNSAKALYGLIRALEDRD